MKFFTETNWNHCQFTNQEKKAIMSLGASPDILENSFIYFVTVLDSENNEIIQEEFTSSALACEHINNKFSTTWDFIDLSTSGEEPTGGCGSCSAH